MWRNLREFWASEFEGECPLTILSECKCGSSVDAPINHSPLVLRYLISRTRSQEMTPECVSEGVWGWKSMTLFVDAPAATPAPCREVEIPPPRTGFLVNGYEGAPCSLVARGVPCRGCESQTVSEGASPCGLLYSDSLSAKTVVASEREADSPNAFETATLSIKTNSNVPVRVIRPDMIGSLLAARHWKLPPPHWVELSYNTNHVIG